MKSEFSKYLSSLGINGAFYERAEHVYDKVKAMVKSDPDNIIVSEYIDNEGKRVYEDLILFLGSKIVEANMFLTQDHYFINCITNCRLVGVQITTKDYDCKNATNQSRLVLRIIFTDNISLNIKASQENCNTVISVLDRYINDAPQGVC